MHPQTSIFLSREGPQPEPRGPISDRFDSGRSGRSRPRAATLRIGRAAGALLALLLALTIGAALDTPAYAAGSRPAQQAPLDGDPLGPLGTRIEDMAKKISKIATPIASFCIALVFMMNLGAPMLPDFAQQNKGYVMRALGIVAFVGFIPELVKFVSALAG